MDPSRKPTFGAHPPSVLLFDLGATQAALCILDVAPLPTILTASLSAATEQLKHARPLLPVVTSTDVLEAAPHLLETAADVGTGTIALNEIPEDIAERFMRATIAALVTWRGI